MLLSSLWLKLKAGKPRVSEQPSTMNIKHHRESFVTVLLFIVVLLATVSLSACADPLSTLKDLDQAYVQIVEKVMPSVVLVTSTRTSPIASDQKDITRGQVPETQWSRGSGFIVTSDGLIMTNNHVIRDMTDIKVSLSDNRIFDAKLLATDPESDVALLKIEAKNLPTITWGDSSKMRVGEIVIAFGSPLGYSGTVTSGIVSALGRTNVGLIDYEDYIQTDAPINPGNSGGPLVNINGQIIGMNTAIATLEKDKKTTGSLGIAFTIPSNYARWVMDQLLKNGKVERGLLGVNTQDITLPLAKSFGRTDTNGALVTKVIPDSPAEKIGIKNSDIILKYNNQLLTGAAHLKNLVGQTKPGTVVKLTVWRNGKTFTVDVTIVERSQKTLIASGRTEEPTNELGVKVEKISPELALKLNIKQNVGVVIKYVSPNSKGSEIGLVSGDIILEINSKTISDVDDFNKKVTAAKEGKIIRFMIQRGKEIVYMAGSF